MEDVGQHIVCAFGQEVSSFGVVESSFGVHLSPQLVWIQNCWGGLIPGGWAFGGLGSESRGPEGSGPRRDGWALEDMAEKGSVGHQRIGRRREGRTAGNWAGKASRRGIYRAETEGTGHGGIKRGVWWTTGRVLLPRVDILVSPLFPLIEQVYMQNVGQHIVSCPRL